MVYSFEHPAIEARALHEIEAFQRRQEVIRSMDLEGLGQRIVELAEAWPDIPHGALVGMAMAGVDPMSSVAEGIERRSVERASGLGFGQPGEVVDPRVAEQLQRDRRGPIGRGLRAGVRGAFMGMETAFEEVRRPVEAGLVALQDPELSFGAAYGQARPSMGRLLASDEFGWEDLGQGWIPGGDIRAEQEELKHNLTLDGHWMSPGRALAINITEPGTKPFNFTSGLIDAAFRVFGDPATYATAGAAKVRHASRAFATDSSLIQAVRRTTNQQHARNWWLGSAPGQRLRRSLVEESSPYEVWRRLGGPQGKVDRETASLIADARDFRQLDDVVLPRLGPQGIAEKPVGRSAISRGVGMALQPFTGSDLGAVHGMGIYLRRGVGDRLRVLGWMPDATIDTSDTSRAMVSINRFLQGIKASPEEHRRLMDRAFRVGDERLAQLRFIRENPGEYVFIGTRTGARRDVESGIATRLHTDPNIAVREAGPDGVVSVFQRSDAGIPARGVGAGRPPALADARRMDPHFQASAREMSEQLPAGAGDNWLEFAKDLTGAAAQRALRDSVGTPTSPREVRFAQQIQENIGRIWKQRHEEVSGYLHREAGRPRSHVPTTVGGQEIDYSQVPQLATEYLSRNIPLPDMQEIRRHIGGYAKAMKAMNNLPRPLVEGTVDFLGGMMTSAWKPLVLLRGAYISRVVGEEQLRMAASGLDSAFRHPVSYFAYLTGRRGGVGVAGNPIREMRQFQAIAQRKGGGHIGRKPGEIGLPDRPIVRRGQVTDNEFARAWADDMSMMVNDETATAVARMGTTEAKDWFWSGKGQKFRRELSTAEHHRNLARSRQAADDYIDGVWLRIEEKTRGNSDLIEAIASGRLDGKQIRWAGPKGGSGPTALQRGLRDRLDEVGISEVRGRRYVTTSRRGSNDHALLDRYNRAVDFGADIIMSKPTNRMSRFPTWQQSYVRNIESQLGFMDAATQQKVIRWAAKEANLSRTQVRRMERTARVGQGNAIPDVETADLIGRAAATRDTRKLLYELTELGQFSDMMRPAMPFAEAWKEIMISWARILRDRPQTIRRGQMAIDGARGSGFFHSDPSTGEEMFTYPGGHLISRALLSGEFDSGLGRTVAGIPGVGPAAMMARGAFMDEQPAEFDMEGRATGLNLFAGSIIPGLGPAVTIPAGRVVPDRPSWDWVRDNLIFPFGAPDTERGIAAAVQPAWMQKFSTALRDNPEADRIYANSVFDVARALVASGEFSTNSPEEIEELMAVSKERAKGLWLVRGASQFALPTGPEINFRVQDLEQQWWPYQVLTQEFHRLREEHGDDVAMDEFIATFGTDLISLVQAKSRQIVPRPISRTGHDWMRENEELASAYPVTIGLIAPDDPTGEFHFPAYQRQFDEGTRERLDPRQMTWLSNDALGRFAYRNAVENIDGNDQGSAEARARIRSELMERFPGFNSHVGVTERPSAEDQINELERMSKDPRLADEPAISGVREYLAAREQANEWVRTMAPRSRSFASSQETAWIRSWLREQAQRIIQSNPSFIPAWERAFERELRDDELTEPGQTSG